jgi:hypothetical protein
MGMQYMEAQIRQLITYVHICLTNTFWLKLEVKNTIIPSLPPKKNI